MWSRFSIRFSASSASVNERRTGVARLSGQTGILSVYKGGGPDMLGSMSAMTTEEGRLPKNGYERFVRPLLFSMDAQTPQQRAMAGCSRWNQHREIARNSARTSDRRLPLLVSLAPGPCRLHHAEYQFSEHTRSARVAGASKAFGLTTGDGQGSGSDSKASRRENFAGYLGH